VVGKSFVKERGAGGGRETEDEERASIIPKPLAAI
jgi:hypothetical protein